VSSLASIYDFVAEKIERNEGLQRYQNFYYYLKGSEAEFSIKTPLFKKNSSILKKEF
jgi:hypothetical protein